MPTLKLTEEDQALLVLLSPEQRDAVILSLLRGEPEEGMNEGTMAVYCGIRRRERERLMTNERVKRYDRKMNRKNDRKINGKSYVFSPSFPPAPPFGPPSLSPPEPPVISPPYNPPTTSQPPPLTRGGAREDAFDAFWKAYPKKVGKQAARKAFQRVKVPLESLLTAIERQKRSAQWRKDGGQFIPNPTTWLNQGRWEDELPEDKPGGEWKTSNPFLEMLEEERAHEP